MPDRTLLSLHDFVRLYEKLTEEGGALRRVLGRRTERVRGIWTHPASPPKHWYNIPAIQKRLNQLASGDAQTDHRTFTAQTFLKNGGLRGLSMGCGAGQKEIQWMQTGQFDQLEAFDLSPQRILAAKEAAQQAGMTEHLTFFVSDATSFHPDPATYDVLIAEASLHHFHSLETLIPRMIHWLKPSGILILHEYVGPARFQWSYSQMAAADALLAQLPSSYRTRWNGRGVKTKHHRPGWLPMWLNDPSEAVMSDRVMPLLHQHLAPTLIRPLGGTVLHLLFDEIAHHFLQPDETATAFLELAFNTEDHLIAAYSLSSDFVFAIFHRSS
ncbi:MAG TPA: class I SAM-dependent methyltransferase [Rhodothermales bacterium]|nr:class I SAM-dependent methyltransferase [Rhodothermales bacterium]HRR09299.1 class I SAM-dependent methyltransferase [Rhodothermales bacterium]